MASKGKIVLHLLAAGGLVGITYGFFYAVDWVNANLINFQIQVYSQVVWIMTAVLAVLVIFSALAKDHARLEMLSSASFLIYMLVAYTVGCSILSFFMPYVGFGQLNVEFMADLTSLSIGVGNIGMALVVANTVAASIAIVGQGIKFLTTFVKAMKRFKE